MQEINKIPRLPRRPVDAHKATMGRILIVAGSRSYQGAAELTAIAALRGGAGLVHLAFPESLYDCYASKLTEIILHPMPQTETGSLSISSLKAILDISSNMDTAAVGPGFSQHRETFQLANALYRELPIPSVFDADGLNALAELNRDISVHSAPRILTPHPGEFARLARGRMEISGNDVVDSNALAALSNTVVVFKSSRPVVGDGTRWQRITSGSAALASAGSGDVLTGLIAALLQRFAAPFDAAVLGTWLHGRAATLGAEELTEECFVASDLFAYFPSAFKEIIDGNS